MELKNLKMLLKSALQKECASLGSISINGLETQMITGVSCNSKAVKEGHLFVAIKGEKFDGHEFLNEAYERGARVAIVETGNGDTPGIKKVKVADTRIALAAIAAEYYCHPSKRLKVVGITGTNGKTTTSYLVKNILSCSKEDAGLIGTISYKIGQRDIPATNTTPGPLELQSLLAQMGSLGLHYCIMEVSSHALEQHRVDGINFSGAAFTNLTPEHLDYHKDMESYFNAKLKLFQNLSPDSFAVLNVDDEYGKRITGLTQAKAITFGLKNKADIMGSSIRLSLEGIQVAIRTPEGDFTVDSKLIGAHNVHNILAATGIGIGLGLGLEGIKKGIEGLKGVPGRLEAVDCGKPFKVFVDYAHTPDALEKLLLALKPLVQHGKLILIFGCGGDRDRMKRPLMGKVAARLSDILILTSDNPRSEEPQAIIGEIENGINGSCHYMKEVDRLEAIKRGLSIASQDDIVVIAGKGHEVYQIFKDVTVPFDDRDVVKKILLNDY